MKRLICAVMGMVALGAAAYTQAPVSLKTPWGEKVTPENAWRNYPRPQMVRAQWTCLNGLWDYAITENALGIPQKWDGEILVPFAPESSLSGVGRRVFIKDMLWYRRTLEAHVKPGERLLLHFEQVDFRTQVFLNGVELDAPHEGGQVPFSFDITERVKDGANELVVAVWDPTEDFFGARGKQVRNPFAIWYTRTSGICGSVWTETVPETHLANYRVTTDFDAGTVAFALETVGDLRHADGTVEVLKDGQRVAAADVKAWNKPVSLALPRPIAAWSPETPALYDFVVTVRDTAAQTVDTVKGYFAMRKVEVKKDPKGVLRIYFNNEMRYLVGTLDQGWWPDGLLTPPSDEAMAFDIQSLKDLGFDMMRKHIKIEPRRYYYLCDKMGMLVLQDMPSGGKDEGRDAVERYGLYRKELKDVVDHLINVPSIFGWVPYNEGWGEPGEFLAHASLMWVKRYDPSRLVDGPSGAHDYEGGEVWGKNFRLTSHKPAGEEEAADLIDKHDYRYRPKPFALNDRRASFLGEYGLGDVFVKDHIWSKPYPAGKPTANVKQKEADILALFYHVRTLARKGIVGSVYTQTTDVEDEVSGFLTYDRKVMKYDVAKIRAANAAIREGARLGVEPTESVEVFPRLDPRTDAWRYTMTQPGPEWTKPGFDDAAWKRSAGGFGSSKFAHDVNANAVHATLWETETLWLRRTFTLDQNAREVVDVVFDLLHDDDVEVYLNGVRLFALAGFTKDWEAISVDPKVFFAAARPGENVLAVKVVQHAGEQYLDLGLRFEVRK